MVCELAGSPLQLRECDLFGFLAWLVVFNNVTKNYDRLQCGRHVVRRLPTAGAPALPQPQRHHRAPGQVPGMARCPPPCEPPPYSTDTQREPDENSGFSPERSCPVEPPASSTTDASAGPAIKLHQVTFTSATLVVIIPHPYSKMYVLVQYNNSYFSGDHDTQE